MTQSAHAPSDSKSRGFGSMRFGTKSKKRDKTKEEPKTNTQNMPENNGISLTLTDLLVRHESRATLKSQLNEYNAELASLTNELELLDARTASNSTIGTFCTSDGSDSDGTVAFPKMRKQKLHQVQLKMAQLLSQIDSLESQVQRIGSDNSVKTVRAQDSSISSSGATNSDVDDSANKNNDKDKNKKNSNTNIELEHLSVWTSTWNMGNAAPHANEVGLWVESGSDIVVIGLQECDFELTTQMKDRAKVSRRQYNQFAASRGGPTAAPTDEENVDRRPSGVEKNKHGNGYSINRNVEKINVDDISEVQKRVSENVVVDAAMKTEVLSLEQVEDMKVVLSGNHGGSKGIRGVGSKLFETTREGPRKLRDGLENSTKSAITSLAGFYVADMIQRHLESASQQQQQVGTIYDGARAANSHDYVMVSASEMYQMRQFVFVKRELAEYVRDVDVASVSTGVGKIGANKGGVATCMNIKGVRVVIINCHLAAHQKYVKHRNENCSSVLKGLRRKLGPERNWSATAWHEHVIFLGDLNYRLDARWVKDNVKKAPEKLVNDAVEHDKKHDSRLDQKLIEEDERVGRIATLASQGIIGHGSIQDVATVPASINAVPLELQKNGEVSAETPDEYGDKVIVTPPASNSGHDSLPAEWSLVHYLVRRKDWRNLFRVDQLLYERSQGRALFGFEEMEMMFAPSFKVRRGIPTCHYIKKRMPSYCDRILWHSTPDAPSTLKGQCYWSAPKVTSSDHKPVIATFQLSIPVVATTVDSRSQPPPTPENIPYPVTSADQVAGSATLCARFTYISLSNNKHSDFNGLADPFVVVGSNTLYGPLSHASNPKKGFLQTPTLRHRLDAKWMGNSDLPPFSLPTWVRNSRQLRNCNFVFTAWDEDRTNSDDVSGECVLGLRKIAELFAKQAAEAKVEQHLFVGDAVEFTLQLSLHGRRTGVLSGAIQLYGSKADANAKRPLVTQKSSALEKPELENVAVGEQRKVVCMPKGCVIC